MQVQTDGEIQLGESCVPLSHIGNAQAENWPQGQETVHFRHLLQRHHCWLLLLLFHSLLAELEQCNLKHAACVSDPHPG